MKNKKRKLKTTVFLLLMLFIVIRVSGNTGVVDDNVKLTGVLYTYILGLDGSTYLFEDWRDCNIQLESGEKATDIKVKFDILHNDLLFYNEELKRIFIIEKGNVKSFIINPGQADSMLFVRYNGPKMGYKLKEDCFVQILSAGKINFLMMHTAYIEIASGANEKDKLLPENLYYLQSNDKVVDIKLKYRSFYNCFTVKKKVLRKLVSNNHLRPANTVNIGRLLKLIEQDSRLLDSFLKPASK
jgi:hypothetical protein